MWHEARKQERLIRGLIVDYRRRAERRKDFYEKIKAEPTQFLQLHGRPCKIHLDPAVAAAGESPAIMMPWQGDSNNLIDRFDVRAHLDFIPEVKNPDVPPEELIPEERQCNYERYRILAQNAFLGISEDKFLQQLAIEEQFGVTIEEKEMQKEKLHEKKGTGAAIGYNYNDPGAQPSSSHGPDPKKVEQKESDDDSDLEIIDVDLSIDVNKMEASQAHELNAVGPQYGMAGCDLFSFLTGDADDAEHQKQLLREEKEKAMFSGRKSRRERRAHRDKKLAHRIVSPPSYAAPRALSSPGSGAGSASPGRSPSPMPDRIEFITSFGNDEEDNATAPPKPLYADKLKLNLKKDPLYSEVVRKPKDRSPRPQMGPHGPPKPRSISRSRSRSGSRSRSRSRQRSRSRSRQRSRSRSRQRSRSRSRSCRSYSRSRSPSSKSRSRSLSPYSKSRNYRRRSRSPQNHGYNKRINTRSMSYESPERAGRPAVARYYGRRRDDRSSSDLSLGSGSSDSADHTDKQSAVGNRSNTNQSQFRLSGTSTKVTSRETLSLKEKLRRKMQAQLSRQLRADKRAEAERLERESRRQQRRDQEMRELAIKLRRKQREMRHQQNRRSSDDDSDGSRSRSSSRGSNSERKRDKSQSRSPSPQEKWIPVWENNRDSPTVPYRPKSDDNSNRRRYDDERKFEKQPRETRDYSQYDKQSREFNVYEKQSRENQYDRQSRDYDKPPREYSQYDKQSRENSQYDKKPREQYDRQPREYHQHEKPRDYNQSREQYDKYPKDYNRFDNQYDKQNRDYSQHDKQTREYNQNDKPREYNRWEQDKTNYRRRPFRGGYRGQGYRNSGPSRYGDGPSNYKDDDSDDKKDDDHPKHKVKLVDY